MQQVLVACLPAMRCDIKPEHSGFICDHPMIRVLKLIVLTNYSIWELGRVLECAHGGSLV